MSTKKPQRIEPKEGLSPAEERHFSALEHAAEKMPRHIAIIMDGNGRWARKRHLPRFLGHRQGMQSVRLIVETAARIHLPYLTLYAFSSENWNRPNEEVTMLMNLLERSIHQELPELTARNIRLRVIGRAQGLPVAVKRGIDHVVNATAGNTGMTLFMAFNYGGRDELVDAFRALAMRVQRGELAPAEIDEDRIGRALYTDGAPDPDLLIRTSGEMRISNFLLWQIAYTELWVTPVLWPDFGPHDLYRAIAEYQRRERRFGGV